MNRDAGESPLSEQSPPAVSELAGNIGLAEMLAQLDNRLRWYFRPVLMVRGPDSWRERAEASEPLGANDADRAAAAMRTHTESRAASYLAQYDSNAAAR